MTEFALKLVDMSISAGWVVLAVLAARLVLKKAPKWLNCALWALVAVRLVCPFSLESALSLIPQSTPVSVNAEEPQAQELPEKFQELDFDGAEPGTIMSVYYEDESGDAQIIEVYQDENGTVKAVEPSENNRSSWQSYLGHFWLVGFAVMLLYTTVSYLRIRKKVRASIDLGNGVYLCDYIDTPFILGIVKPKIYLPSDMDPKDAAHVLSHERSHLKRRDHWWKPLGFALLAVYWFHPLLWVAYILLCRDIELACDEKVIRDMGTLEKKAYSEALLKCSVPRHMILACPLAFGEVSVKERVKSILHYKKPGFWILLVSIVIVAVVAVCFLTDPKQDTLANIIEMQEDELVRIDLWSRTSRTTFETKEEIHDFLDFLDTLEYDPAPAASEPITKETDENNWSYQTIDIYYEDREEHILFNYDYTLVWTRDANGNNSLPYHMKDSEQLLDYLNDHVTPVINRESSAEPFAQQDQPTQWLQGICMEALRSASLYNGYNNYLTNVQTSKLIAVLNSIPETSIGSQRYDEDFTHSDLTAALASIVLKDDANNLTGILQCQNGIMELVLISSSDYHSNPWRKQQISPALIWTIDSEALRSLFTDLINDPPNLLASSNSGYIFNEKLEVISDGNTTISTHTLENWDYKIIQPEDGEDFFGFRCKPKKEAEGWVTFGWWGDRFVPADTEESYQSNLYGYHFTYTNGYTDSTDGSEAPSIRYERAHCSHGDFVIIYENTDSWTQRYQEDVSWLPFFAGVQCEMHHSLAEVSDEVADALVNMSYYDWDSIARDLGTQSMTLFDPQYYEGYLFVGLSHDDDYHIACFRQVDSWDYEFVELLDPISKFLPQDKTALAPVAEFENGDSTWLLYVIDDESVTGIQCHSGFWGYIPLSGHPSLVLLEESLWGNDAYSSALFDLRYDDPPALDFMTQNNGSIFEFNESSQYYLYDCVVNYNDAKNPPGSYSLETEELRQLANILTSLPELTQNVTVLNDEGLFDVGSSDASEPKVYMQLRLDDTHLYVWSQDGAQRLDWGDVRLELYYCDGSLTLGVNMEDLGKDFYRSVYYYQVDSAELEAFMLSKCDPSRNGVSLAN